VIVKKRISFWIGFVLIGLTAACVDPISFDTDTVAIFPIVVEGSISDDPGPYEVRVSKAFDLETQKATRERARVKRLNISDNVGNSEDLQEIELGVYRTNAEGIQGVVGRAYTLRVELLDGRVYETIPDTMKVTGSVSKIEHEVVEYTNLNGVPEYGFDIFFDSQANENKEFRFMWKLVMTYEVSSNPEEHYSPCFRDDCVDPTNCFCPEPLLCSGFIFNDTTRQLEYVGPCECCHCWLELRNDLPVMSEGQLTQNGIFTKVKAGRLPITAQTMQYKTHVEVQQYSLSQVAYDFWNSITAQKQAISSLFQPLSGKITGNFVQLAGTPTPIEGIFYTASVSRNSIYITADDVPDVKMIKLSADSVFSRSSCLDFPGATNRRPTFWK